MKKLALLIPVLLPAIALADFPERDITYQITFSPGGGSDSRARAQQPFLEEDLGVKMPKQYKPGGGGSIGWTNRT